jgi:hypothetical protein
MEDTMPTHDDLPAHADNLAQDLAALIRRHCSDVGGGHGKTQSVSIEADAFWALVDALQTFAAVLRLAPTGMPLRSLLVETLEKMPLLPLQGQELKALVESLTKYRPCGCWLDKPCTAVALGLDAVASGLNQLVKAAEHRHWTEYQDQFSPRQQELLGLLDDADGKRVGEAKLVEDLFGGKPCDQPAKALYKMFLDTNRKLGTLNLPLVKRSKKRQVAPDYWLPRS